MEIKVWKRVYEAKEEYAILDPTKRYGKDFSVFQELCCDIFGEIIKAGYVVVEIVKGELLLRDRDKRSILNPKPDYTPLEIRYSYNYCLNCGEKIAFEIYKTIKYQWVHKREMVKEVIRGHWERILEDKEE